MPKLWEKSMTLAAFKKKNTLPETPGVYFFLGEKGELLYIGKATILHDRVKSYFSRDITETRGPKIALMLGKIQSIAHRKTDSVLEALILETNLIKEYQPPYNTDQKDDKSFNHVVITDEPFPRVLVVRGRDLLKKRQEVRGKKQEYRYIFGPFPSGGGLREAMKIVRRLFPYRDKCTPIVIPAHEQESRSRVKPGMTKKNRAIPRACFNRQIGLCPGVCTGEISAKEYGRIINHIRLFFEGRKGILVKQLEREMKAAAKALEFERAGEIKKTLFGLQHIQDMALVKDEMREKKYEVGERMRVEAYDAAHLMGQASVGVMTVVEGGRAEKEAYKKFTLREVHGGDDLSALREILSRRLKHPEWGIPDVVVTDGSDLQLSVAKQAFAEAGFEPLLVGVVKDSRHKAREIIGLPTGFARLEADILLANSEAHRFAIAFHRKRRGKEFLG
jgi:excinuclease ABC subunit C